jgi:hypothetical protein
MPTRIPLTEFAPAERAPISVIHRQSAALTSTQWVGSVLHSLGPMVFIVNSQRQIVFASPNVLDLLPGKTVGDLLGQRPGEALGCDYAKTGPNGCGTDRHCRQCGAAKAILQSLAGQRNAQELRLTRVLNVTPKALDLLICATPFCYEGEAFSILSVTDISHEKRRRVLERSLFNGLKPSVNGLARLVTTMRARSPAKVGKDLQRLEAGLHQMLDQIQAQKDLAAAENGTLTTQPASFQSREWLRQFIEQHVDLLPAQRRRLRLDLRKPDAAITTDPALLGRALQHLLDNALEAASPPKAVTIGCRQTGGLMQFWVHNPGKMSPAAQLQIFRRSFTTKGPGRGLGTYLTKLLVEDYLGGTVNFKTGSQSGTTFMVTLPVEQPPQSGRPRPRSSPPKR